MIRDPLEGRDFLLVETERALREVSFRLLTEEVVGVDTESDSYYHYFEKVCLIQFSTPSKDIIIDTLATRDLSPLKPFFEGKTRKVFHGADYDIPCLRRDFGIRVENLFDTHVAARALGRKKTGLRNLVEEIFGFHLNKDLQTYDWSKRPLNGDAIRYACLDTCFLPSLFRIIEKEAREAGKEDGLREEFATLQEKEWSKPPFDPERYILIRGARTLNRKERSLLKRLYSWREEKAMALDLAPFRVLPNRALMRISEKKPLSLELLKNIKSVPDPIFTRYGVEIVDLVAELFRS